MIFSYFILVSALSLEFLASFIAILGFADKAGPILIAILITLDVAKIIIATVVYKYWKIMNWVFKVILIPALLVLMGFTSGGAFGYVSKEFTKIMLPQEQNNIELVALQKEQVRLQERKKEIDEQIAKVPDNAPTAKRRLIETFAPETGQINARLVELDKSIPEKEKAISQQTTEGGTILSVAKTLNQPPETVILYFSALITLFLDPLAIVLLTLGNFLIAHRKEIKILEKQQEALDNQIQQQMTEMDKNQQNSNTATEAPNTVEATPTASAVQKQVQEVVPLTSDVIEDKKEMVLELVPVENEPLNKTRKFNKKRKNQPQLSDLDFSDSSLDEDKEKSYEIVKFEDQSYVSSYVNKDNEIEALMAQNVVTPIEVNSVVVNSTEQAQTIQVNETVAVEQEAAQEIQPEPEVAQEMSASDVVEKSKPIEVVEPVKNLLVNEQEQLQSTAVSIEALTKETDLFNNQENGQEQIRDDINDLAQFIETQLDLNETQAQENIEEATQQEPLEALMPEAHVEQVIELSQQTQDIAMPEAQVEEVIAPNQETQDITENAIEQSQEVAQSNFAQEQEVEDDTYVDLPTDYEQETKAEEVSQKSTNLKAFNFSFNALTKNPVIKTQTENPDTLIKKSINNNTSNTNNAKKEKKPYLFQFQNQANEDRDSQDLSNLSDFIEKMQKEQGIVAESDYNSDPV